MDASVRRCDRAMGSSPYFVCGLMRTVKMSACRVFPLCPDDSFLLPESRILDKYLICKRFLWLYNTRKFLTRTDLTFLGSFNAKQS